MAVIFFHSIERIFYIITAKAVKKKKRIFPRSYLIDNARELDGAFQDETLKKVRIGVCRLRPTEAISKLAIKLVNDVNTLFFYKNLVYKNIKA